MSSPWIQGLRSVAFNVPDLAQAERFYTEVWHLVVASRTPRAIYLRGSGADHHLLALHQADALAIRKVTLRARSLEALGHIAAATVAAGGRILDAIGPIDEPGGGQGLRLADPHGRIYEVLYGDVRHADAHEAADQPLRLAHAVFNSHDVVGTQTFMEQALRFRLTDRTKIMAFMNCDRDHHTIAIGDTDNDALNHIAFLMPTLDDVMRGGGRMKDAGFPIAWGPGRHGPGDNAFNYFVGPFGEVIEYTAEVEQIDDSYQAGSPSDWTWPPGRVDQWGIAPPEPRLKEAQRRVHFMAI
jgi:catechol-2,3-dioxygenase